MINPISDGQPITYDLLNQIINEVNKVTSTYTDEIKQIVQVYGQGIGRKEDDRAQIAVGSIDVSVPKSSKIPLVEVNFPNNVGFDAAPYISVTVVDTKRGDKGEGLNAANATVVELGKNKFSVKLQLLKPVDNPTTIRLHYIAIGPGSASGEFINPINSLQPA